MKFLSSESHQRFAGFLKSYESVTDSLLKSSHWLFFIITPSCILTAWWLVIRFEKFAGGSGIPQVMASIELFNARDHGKIKSLLSIRAIIVKIISSLFMILGGCSGQGGRNNPDRGFCF